MDSTELDSLVNPEEGDDDLVKNLRAALKDGNKAGKAKDSELEELRGFKAATERAGLFDSAGIPAGKEGDLLREAMASTEDLTVEKIREKALAHGILEAPTPEAGVGEQEAHQAVDDAASAAPAPLPDAMAAIAAAETPEEVLRLAQASGMGLVTDE